jgi:two-component system NtrC family response regulator
VRILCATHRDLRQSIQEGTFREDLYYRISEIVIEVPPLREREGDRVLLARCFLDKFSQENGRSFRGFTEQALAQIDAYTWPGNVRELENMVKRAVVLAEGNRITVADLGFAEDNEAQSLNLRQAREQLERQFCQRALAIHNNNVSRAADALGVSRPSLYKLLKKLGMAESGK